MSKYEILKSYEQFLVYVQDIFGDRVTNNVQLDNLCYKLFGSDYLGTYSSNMFPKYIKRGQVFILNTQSSRKSGEHWVAFAKLNNGTLIYYDSYARNKSELSKYWKNRKMVNANKTDRDQSYKSEECGSRCIAFLILVKRFGEKAINIV